MKFWIFTLVLFVLSAGIGYCANELYDYYGNVRHINGLWIDGNITKATAIEKAQQYDSIGDWVCININGMSVQEMIKTCEHEASHEIFAEYCENNATRCLEAVK